MENENKNLSKEEKLRKINQKICFYEGTRNIRKLEELRKEKQRILSEKID